MSQLALLLGLRVIAAAPDPPEGFGTLVRRNRAAAGLTQEELAELTGLGVRTISDIERGLTLRPHRSSVDMLSAALNLDRSGKAQEHHRAAHPRDPAGPDPAGPGGAAAAAPRQPAEPSAEHSSDSRSVADQQPGRVVRRQLPAAVSGFAGRAPELLALDELLGQVDAAPGTTVIALICGTAGVGKTTLAVHWSHRVPGEFPDGQLYLNLRGFDPSGTPVAPAAAVRALLDGLEVPARQIPPSLDAQAALYRSLMTGRRMLVLLDNARDADQVRPLLPGGPGCLVVVTSRSQLVGLVAVEDARPVTLDVLTVAESRDLLARRLGAVRIGGEPDAVDELIALCARLPLALAIVAARAALGPADLLTSLAQELRSAPGQLTALDAGEATVSGRLVFSWSYQELSESAARMFRLLGLHPGPDVGLRAAASLAGVSVDRARELLQDLGRANLVSERSPGRYYFHDLLRAYARELSIAVETEQARTSVMHRMLDYYLHSARSAALILHPNAQDVVVAAPQPGVVTESFSDYNEAMAWTEAESQVTLAAVVHAGGAGFDAHAAKLAMVLRIYLDRRAYYADYASTQQMALEASVRLGDLAGQARAYQGLGNASVRLGALDNAYRYFGHALELCLQLGDRAGQGLVYVGRAFALEQGGRLQDALADCLRALELFEAIGDRGRQATLLNNTGWCHARLGDFEAAAERCGRAATLYEQLGDLHGESAALDSLGCAYHGLGDQGQAAECHRRSAELTRALGDPHGSAMALDHLGDALLAAGDRDGACEVWREALETFDEMRHRGAEQVRAKLDSLG